MSWVFPEKRLTDMEHELTGKIDTSENLIIPRAEYIGSHESRGFILHGNLLFWARIKPLHPPSIRPSHIKRKRKTISRHIPPKNKWQEVTLVPTKLNCKHQAHLTDRFLSATQVAATGPNWWLSRLFVTRHLTSLHVPCSWDHLSKIDIYI